MQTSAAVAPEILDRSEEKVDAVLEKTQADVAAITNNPAYLPRSMIVVNRKMPTLSPLSILRFVREKLVKVLLANWTFVVLFAQNFLIFFQGHPVSSQPMPLSSQSRRFSGFLGAKILPRCDRFAVPTVRTQSRCCVLVIQKLIARLNLLATTASFEQNRVIGRMVTHTESPFGCRGTERELAAAVPLFYQEAKK
jgi:hypothetical protein